MNVIWSLLDVLETEVMVQTCMFYKSCRISSDFVQEILHLLISKLKHLLHSNPKGLAFSSQMSSEKCSSEYKLSAVLHQQNFLGKTTETEDCKFKWLVLDTKICSP